MPPAPKPYRNYCYLIDGRKYDRNAGCKAHDNAYGIRGGGSEADRRRIDRAFHDRMRANRDPMAFPAWLACACFGWFFFNYDGRPWRGQLVRRFVKAPGSPS